MTHSQLAKLAQVSKATVSKWFNGPPNQEWVNVETKSLIQMGQGLDLDPQLFMQKRPLLKTYRSLFLWDSLYEDMESFLIALLQKRKPAQARLVQTLGFHESTAVAGKSIIKDFPLYKKFIHPARRKQLDVLWPLYHSAQ